MTQKFDVDAMTDRSHLGRAAQCFERHNAPDMRRDAWAERLQIAKTILLAAALGFFIGWIAVSAFAAVHAPVNPPY